MALKTNLKRKNGFTLLELLISMFIIVMLSGMFLIIGNIQNAKLALSRSAFRLAQELRWAQEKAMDGVLFDCPGGGQSYFLGVSVSEASEANGYFIVFADCNSDRQRDLTGKEDIKKVFFEANIAIGSLSPPIAFDLLFAPPEPLVYLNGVSDFSEALVVLEDINDPLEIKTIKINSVGRIEIE